MSKPRQPDDGRMPFLQKAVLVLLITTFVASVVARMVLDRPAQEGAAGVPEGGRSFVAGSAAGAVS